MKKILLVTIVSLIVNVNVIYAECTTKDREYYESIKDKYSVSNYFERETETYKLYLTYDDDTAFSYEIEGEALDAASYEFNDNVTIVGNLKPGEYTLRIVGVSENCSDTFSEETITLPKYNLYSYDEACDGIEEFVLCNPTYDKEIDYDTFISRVNSYKKEKAKKNNTDNKTDNKTTIIDWLKSNFKYIIYGLIGTIGFVLIAIIIKIVYNKERKRRRLEW